MSATTGAMAGMTSATTSGGTAMATSTATDTGRRTLWTGATLATLAGERDWGLVADGALAVRLGALGVGVYEAEM